jgi:hypothetical protein
VPLRVGRDPGAQAGSDAAVPMSILNREGTEKTDVSMKLESDTPDRAAVVDRNEKTVVMISDVGGRKIVAVQQILDAGTISGPGMPDPDISFCAGFLHRSSPSPTLVGWTRYLIV